MIPSDQWHTPANIIELVRETMLTIDCDPASNDIAQETVKAYHYYTDKYNGLYQPWVGNIYCNPPYSKPNLPLFVDKLKHELSIGNVRQAIFITKDDASTMWFKELISITNVLCLPYKRPKFTNTYRDNNDGGKTSSFIFYIGDNASRFKSVFKSFGNLLESVPNIK